MNVISKSQYAQLIHENRGIYDEHFDLEYCRALSRNILDLLNQVYFRTEFIGFDELPERNNSDHPLIYASNHSGMAFPWDAEIFIAGLFKKHNYEITHTLRALVAPLLSSTRLMSTFMIEDFWKRCGGVDASVLNFDTMMHYQDCAGVMIYPEGVPGIGKGFNRKYEFQRFATSFIRMSLKYKTDIIPVYTVNGEYINPHSYSFDWINKIVNKVGIPFLPVGWLTFFLPFCPWLFYFSFPAKLTYVRGKRIAPYTMTETPFESITKEEVNTICNKVKEEMQAGLDKSVEKYGQNPYNWTEFWKRCKEQFAHFPSYTPWGWVAIFTEFERQWKIDPTSTKIETGFLNTIKYMFKNPITFAYFIPIVGWIPLAIKGYKKQNIKRKVRKYKVVEDDSPELLGT